MGPRLEVGCVFRIRLYGLLAEVLPAIDEEVVQLNGRVALQDIALEHRCAGAGGEARHRHHGGRRVIGGVGAGSVLWQERLAFRDRLRADAGVAAESAAFKLSLAEKYELDREAYTDAKEPFVRRVLASMGLWS